MVGKSDLCNAMRGITDDQDNEFYAPLNSGIYEESINTKYYFKEYPYAAIQDLPGGGIPDIAADKDNIRKYI